MTSLLHTLLELGHITSQNLGFAQTTHGGITFSEETITETNLLEFRRRHPGDIHVYSFSKATESKTTGADWEWHIIGRARTLKMRVQAKRIYKAGGIGNLYQQGKKAPKPQIDLLFEDAKLNGLLPIYCFYSSEAQRSHWTIGNKKSRHPMMESGCLIVDARAVRSNKPRKLSQIERDCVPWHYLCVPGQFSISRHPYLFRYLGDLMLFRTLEEVGLTDRHIPFERNFPTVFELNRGEVEANKQRGVYSTVESPLMIPRSESYKERGISRLLQIDARESVELIDPDWRKDRQ